MTKAAWLDRWWPALSVGSGLTVYALWHEFVGVGAMWMGMCAALLAFVVCGIIYQAAGGPYYDC